MSSSTTSTKTFEALATHEVLETPAVDPVPESPQEQIVEGSKPPKKNRRQRAKAAAAKAATAATQASELSKSHANIPVAVEAEESRKSHANPFPRAKLIAEDNKDTPRTGTDTRTRKNAQKSTATNSTLLPTKSQGPYFGPVLAPCLIPGCPVMAQHEARRFQRFENALPNQIKVLQGKKRMTSQEWEEMERFFRVHEKRGRQVRAAKTKREREAWG